MRNVFENSMHTYLYCNKPNCSFNLETGRLYYLRYVESGEATVTVNNKSINLKANDIVFVLPETKLTVKNKNTTTGTVISIRHFPGVDELVYPFQKVTLDPYERRLLNAIGDISNENITDECVYGVYKFLDVLQQKMIKNNNIHIAQIRKALDYMRNNNNFSVPQLAAMCQMSERRFYATFKELLGITPIQMKRKIQAQKGAELLEHTDLKVKDISNKIGFASDNYFRKIIKERYDNLPKEVRKNTKSKNNFNYFK